MKTSYFTPKQSDASTLFTTLVIAAVVGMTLVAYLKMVSNENYLVQRSQAWNATIPVIEAGLEEGLAHLNKNGTNNNLTADGWILRDGLYVKQNSVGDNFYIVTIKYSGRPEIVSQGYTYMQPNYASANGGPFFAAISPNQTLLNKYVYRTVKTKTKIDGIWVKGMVAKDQIDLSGNNIHTDSFDSADPLYSTNGQYIVSKARDNGDVATDGQFTNSLAGGNANIWGHVATGPGGTVSIGSNGGVGDMHWMDDPSHYGKIEPGWSTDDMNVSFPPVSEPQGTFFSPGGGNWNGDHYNYMLDGGNFQMSSVSIKGQKDMVVTAPSVLWITDKIAVGGSGQITIAPGGSLTLYVGTKSGSSATADLGGNGIINMPGNATNFYYYGLPSNTSLSYGGNGTFIGAIYAPNAAFTLGGGGNTLQDFAGASVSKTVKLNGHFNFHYDENLGRVGPIRAYIILSWDEVRMDPITPPGG